MMRCQTTSARSWPKAIDVVVLADETRALRNEQMPAGDAVEHVFRDLGDDEAGQVGIQAADQAGGDDGAGHQLVGRSRLLQAVRIVDILLGSRLQEGQLARLLGRVVRRQIDIAGRQRARARLQPAALSRVVSSLSGALRLEAGMRSGSELGFHGLARRCLQLQAEEHLGFPRLAGHAREAGLLDALRLGDRIVGGLRQLGNARR